MLTVEEIRAHLQDRNLRRVAEATGLHPNTVYALARGDTMPSYETVRVVSDYLTREVAP